MAGKTNTEKIDELAKLTAVQDERLENIRKDIEGLPALTLKVALVEQRLNDLCGKVDEAAERRWSIIQLVFGALLGGSITLVSQAVIKQLWP